MVGDSKWQIIVSFVSFIVLIAGALITFFVQESTLATEVAAAQQRLVALEQQVSVMAERASVERVRIDERANATNTAVAEINTSLIEVETQFCAQDIVRNLMHANDLRFFALLWRKEFPDSAMPTDNAYYPTICNRNIKNGGYQGAR